MNEEDQILNAQMSAIDEMLLALPINFLALKYQLISTLEYLASPQGKNNRNCCILDNHASAHWLDAELPSDFFDLISDIGGCLHDTFGSPNIAENFESTPEQLLTRARNLKTEPATGENAARPTA